MQLLENFCFLADLIALKPASYIIRLVMAGAAFSAAMNTDSVIKRVIGLAFLIVIGIALFFIGIQNFTPIDLILGIACLSGAGYSWWYSRC